MQGFQFYKTVYKNDFNFEISDQMDRIDRIQELGERANPTDALSRVQLAKEFLWNDS